MKTKPTIQPWIWQNNKKTLPGKHYPQYHWIEYKNTQQRSSEETPWNMDFIFSSSRMIKLLPCLNEIQPIWFFFYHRIIAYNQSQFRIFKGACYVRPQKYVIIQILIDYSMEWTASKLVVLLTISIEFKIQLYQTVHCSNILVRIVWILWRKPVNLNDWCKLLCYNAISIHFLPFKFSFSCSSLPSNLWIKYSNKSHGKLDNNCIEPSYFYLWMTNCIKSEWIDRDFKDT